MTRNQWVESKAEDDILTLMFEIQATDHIRNTLNTLRQFSGTVAYSNSRQIDLLGSVTILEDGLETPELQLRLNVDNTDFTNRTSG